MSRFDEKSVDFDGCSFKKAMMWKY